MLWGWSVAQVLVPIYLWDVDELVTSEIILLSRKRLRAQKPLQVLKLLELMGLKAYKEAFMAERVNGEVLLECDEDVLLNELKVVYV